MADLGDDFMTTACKKLVIDSTDYPRRIPRMGMVNLLAGTKDVNSKDWQTWASMVWTMGAPQQRWVGDDPKHTDYTIQHIDLLIASIDRPTALRWIKSIRQPMDGISEQFKHWLGDYLVGPGRPSQARQHRLGLLRQVVEGLKAIDQDLHTNAMPGIRADLLELCHRMHPRVFEMSEKTFKSYLKEICSFRSGARSSSYYRDKLSQLS
jgi:hypothetical protein